MKEQLITFETAKLAKERGFNEICNSCYDINGEMHNGMNHKNDLGENVYSAPTQSLLQKWVRVKHEIHINLIFDDNTWYIEIGKFTIPDFIPDIEISMTEKDGFKDSINAYEESLELGLTRALKQIKL